MNCLVLKRGEDDFERLFYLAVCLGDSEIAARHYQEYLNAPTPHFWQEVCAKENVSDKIIMSAIINHLNMPFGAYAFARYEEELIEVVPLLYSEKFDGELMETELFSKETRAETLRTYAILITQTADFIEWLNRFNKKRHKA